MPRRQRGLYEVIITEALNAELQELPAPLEASRSPLRSADAADRIALHVGRVVQRAVAALDDRERPKLGAALARQLIDLVAQGAGDLALERPLAIGEVLRAIRGRLPDGTPERIAEPLIPLLDTTLLTNAPGEPRVGSQILEEIRSADRIDAVLAFIRHSGIAPMLEALRVHCGVGRKLRILTTTYTGSTEARALDELAALGAEVRVSYDTTSTRLHAKAWLFHRESGFSTAYIGSSNLTHSAQVSGLEWNVRVSQARNPPVVEKVAAVFATYWEGGDFLPYDREEFLRNTQSEGGDGARILLSAIELRPEPFQERMLEQIALSRQQGHHRNLLVSATGTGKTVMAALDYVRLREAMRPARLLFVAHRAEILKQSLATFRYAVHDAAFGELWVAGDRPRDFEHVFASIQSLHAGVLGNIDPKHFDIVIIDEFHHAAASSYQRLIEHLQPKELLGLTATPERGDGQPILHLFDNRIAAELRVWDAIDQHRLVPFIYYGIHDGLSLQDIPWRRGRGYDVEALTNLMTGNDVWAAGVVQQLARHVGDVGQMRALGFCVSIEHARFMARIFNAANIKATAVWSETSEAERQQALADLDARRVNVVFSVDLFNEGIDVRSVDTILMLRPTESATLFLQQLGRGLRRNTNKSTCTVLDFVGMHRKEFRFDLRLRALLGGSRSDVMEQVQSGFPFLPAGCHMQLDRVAEEIVLDSLRNAIPSGWTAKVAELRDLLKDGTSVSLAVYLKETGRDLEEVYANDKSWSDLCADAGVATLQAGPHEVILRRACGRLLHIDDSERIDTYKKFLSQESAPNLETLTTREQRLLRMLLAPLLDKAVPKEASIADGTTLLRQHPQVRAELLDLLPCLASRVSHVAPPLASAPDLPLRLHARYSRLEILAAFGVGSGAKVAPWQTGVYWAKEARADLFAFTLDKTSGQFSPTTRYRDYAITHELIHWESQSVTRESSETGLRYQQHASMGTAVMLFARQRSDERSFYFLGPATYVRHEGELPMAITWKLAHRLPGDLFTAFAAAVA